MSSHTIIFESEDRYWNYLWPVVWIWAIDRLLRIVRLVYCNFQVHGSHEKTIQTTRSTAIYDKASDVIRLVAVPGNSPAFAAPGQYYFLYQPFRFRGWESHPFTLGAWRFAARRKEVQPPLSAKRTNSANLSEVPLLSESSKDTMQGSTDKQQEFIFWIRPYNGWTLSLRNECLRSQDYTTDVTILLEGPYGDQVPLWNYESVLLIAGGTGIASAVPYIQEHLSRSSPTADLSGTHTSRIHNLRLVWSCRQAAFIQNLAENELQTAFTRDEFQASFYTTATPETRNVGDAVHHSVHEGNAHPLHIEPRRPNLTSVVLDHAFEASGNGSSAAMLVCGPPGMADEVRAAVHSARRQGCSAVRYVEESFTW